MKVTALMLRPAEARELPALTELCLRSKAAWGYDADFIRQCRKELTLSEHHLATTHVQVAEVDGRTVGVVQVELDGQKANLCKLFVEPGHMRCGIGLALLDWAIQVASKRGGTHMDIESDPEAAGFYRGQGAIEIGTAPSLSIPGRLLPKLRLDFRQLGKKPEARAKQ